MLGLYISLCGNWPCGLVITENYTSHTLNLLHVLDLTSGMHIHHNSALTVDTYTAFKQCKFVLLNKGCGE